MDRNISWTLIVGLDIASRHCDDGVLVFDNTRNVTHLIAEDAWNLYSLFLRNNRAASSEQVGLPEVANMLYSEEQQSLLEALETAGLLRKC